VKTPSHKLLLGIGVPLFLFGMAIVPGWRLAKWIGGSRLTRVEFPLSDPSDVAVDSKGRIYVADGMYSRVQRYSPEGRFQLGWFVPTAGVFALKTLDNDRLQVATARANKLLTYSADGDLITGLYWQDTDHYLEFANERRTTGGYVVRRGLLPHVDARDGQTIIATPASKRVISGPFPAMAYCVVGLAFVAAAEWRRRRGGAR
jgi:NHL repeat